jgi:hypothetical protein
VRIVLRTSGGRGEYELAGHQAAVSGVSLLDKDLDFELTPELVVPGHQTAYRVQGKPRIRLDDTSSQLHAYRFLAGALLLPKPKRELKTTLTTLDFVRDNGYAVAGIDVDVAETQASSARLRPTTLWLENAAGLILAVDVPDRMALVQEIWDVSRNQTTQISGLVRIHEASVSSGDHKAIENASAKLREAIGDGDVIERIAKAAGAQINAPPLVTGAKAQDIPVEGEQDETDPADARRRAVAKWRKSVQRTAEARKFSEAVRMVYDERCAVSGSRLPKLSSTLSPGVEGAHILPWARYELNTVKNGICLSKLCHWAFDAGVIRIDYDEGAYMVSIPEEVSTGAVPANMDLTYFEKFVGPISDERLPADSAHLPSPDYLARLNEEMYG